MGIVTPLRWLLSLVTRQPARITSLHGVLADNPRAVFEVIYQSTEPRDDARYVHPYAMAVKLPDFDVPVALPRWFDIYERLRTPMALFFANWFSSGLYMENRVLNAAGAVE